MLYKVFLKRGRRDLILTGKKYGDDMAFPLATVLAAAPGVISAAADIIRVIRKKKEADELPENETTIKDKIAELESLLERQALVIEELALSNRNLALEVRNNRAISVISLVIAIVASCLAIFL